MLWETSKNVGEDSFLSLRKKEDLMLYPGMLRTGRAAGRHGNGTFGQLSPLHRRGQLVPELTSCLRIEPALCWWCNIALLHHVNTTDMDALWAYCTHFSAAFTSKKQEVWQNKNILVTVLLHTEKKITFHIQLAKLKNHFHTHCARESALAGISAVI